VISFIVGVGPLGAALLVSLFIVGQMVGSVVLDHFGWLGLRAQPINAWRLGGLALLAIGVVMIERGGVGASG
jgi:transporter family-2 protein